MPTVTATGAATAVEVVDLTALSSDDDADVLFVGSAAAVSSRPSLTNRARGKRRRKDRGSRLLRYEWARVHYASVA